MHSAIDIPSSVAALLQDAAAPGLQRLTFDTVPYNVGHSCLYSTKWGITP